MNNYPSHLHRVNRMYNELEWGRRRIAIEQWMTYKRKQDELKSVIRNAEKEISSHQDSMNRLENEIDDLDKKELQRAIRVGIAPQDLRPIEEVCNFSPRTLNSLYHYQREEGDNSPLTVDQLRAFTEEDYASMRGFGVTARKEVVAWLEANPVLKTL